MQCQFAQELFSDHIADALDRAQKVSLDNHLAECADCREQVAGLRDVWAALDTLPVMEPPKFFHENIMDRLAMEAAKEQEAKESAKSAGFDWKSLFRARSLAFGAAALILLLGSLEAVQTQRSAMGPFGWVAGLFAKPAPAAPISIKNAQAIWVADGENGGSLNITLRVSGSANLLNYTVTQAGNSASLASGNVAPDRDKIIKIQMPALPAPDSLSIKITDSDSTRSAAQTLTLPAP